MKGLFLPCFCVSSVVCTIGLGQDKGVHIHGHCKDMNINSIDVVESMWFPRTETNNSKLASSVRSENNSFDLKFTVDHPRFFYLSSLVGNRAIYCTPGDSLNFEIEKNGLGARDYTVKFTGSNADQYNYFIGLEEIAPQLSIPRFKSDVNSFKRQVDNWHDKQYTFLKDYALSHTLSKDFVRLETAAIDYERCYLLYSPLRSGLVKIGDLPEGYFNEVNSLRFNDDKLLDLPWFRSAMVRKYVYCWKENPWDNFDIVMDNLKRNFSGRIKEYLTASAIGIYAKEQLQGYRESLLTSIQSAQKTIKDSLFLAYISGQEKDYLMLDKPFPDPVMNSTQLKDFSTNGITSLASVLKLCEGKAIYLDFWASWCFACRVDIEESTEAKQYLKKQDVVYVYISLDKSKDEEKWKAAAAKDQATSHQYLLQLDFASPLAGFLKINYLPRYVILDNKHVIKFADAPRPTPYQLEKLKSNVGQLTEHRVDYK